MTGPSILPCSQLTSTITCPHGHLPSALKSSPGTRGLSPQDLQHAPLATNCGFLPHLLHQQAEWLGHAGGEVNPWLYYLLAEMTVGKSFIFFESTFPVCKMELLQFTSWSQHAV